MPPSNGENRERTALANDIVQAMDAHFNHQVFALVVWRYYNTKDAWESHIPKLIQFTTDEDVEEWIYNDNKEKS